MTERDLGRTLAEGRTLLFTRMRDEVVRRVVIVDTTEQEVGFNSWMPSTSQQSIASSHVTVSYVWRISPSSQPRRATTMGKRKKSSRKPAPARQKVPLGLSFGSTCSMSLIDPQILHSHVYSAITTSLSQSGLTGKKELHISPAGFATNGIKAK